MNKKEVTCVYCYYEHAVSINKKCYCEACNTYFKKQENTLKLTKEVRDFNSPIIMDIQYNGKMEW